MCAEYGSSYTHDRSSYNFDAISRLSIWLKPKILKYIYNFATYFSDNRIFASSWRFTNKETMISPAKTFIRIYYLLIFIILSKITRNKFGRNWKIGANVNLIKKIKINYGPPTFSVCFKKCSHKTFFIFAFEYTTWIFLFKIHFITN